MSPEKLGAQTRFSIFYEDVVANPNLRTLYHAERIAAIKRGESVWMAHGIGLPSHEDSIYLYYYQEGKLVGRVEGSDLDGYHVFGPALEEDDTPYHHLNTEPKMLLSEAQKALVDYIEGTSH